MNVPLWIAIPITVLVVLATRADVRTRKIPNALTGSALLLGVLVRWALEGPAGAGNALASALVAGALLFPGWLLRFTGAGDVKLMAAVGAWLGHPLSLLAALASLIAGGVIALVVAWRRGVLVQSFRNMFALGAMLLPGRLGAERAMAVTSGVRFPFAPAILAGAVFALLARH